MPVSRTSYLLAAAAIVCLATATRAEDLANTVAGELRDSGALTGYRVNVKSKSGTIWLEGQVADDRQLAAAIGIAEATPGVERVVNRLVIGQPQAGPTTGSLGLPSSAWNSAGVSPPAPVAPAAKPTNANPFSAMTELLFAVGESSDGTVRLAQATQAAAPMPRAAVTTARPIPIQGRPAGSPRIARQTGGQMSQPMTLPAPGGHFVDGQMMPGTRQSNDGVPAGDFPIDGGAMAPGMPGPGPMPGGPSMPPVPIRADGPNMPNYAWPSYTAYPNYAGLQYPTQYSPTAWPYIGPFYPYPQVPLGWRRVSLEWDDGWWWLDFDDRHIHSHHR